MRTIGFLALAGLSGTAFAQSTPTLPPAPRGAPVANRTGDRLDTVATTAEQALFDARAALARLDVAEAKIRSLQARSRASTSTPAPTVPTTTIPTTLVVPPTPAGMTDGQHALAQIVELKTEIAGLIVPILGGLDDGAGDRLLLALADAGPTGLIGRVDTVEDDVAALAAIVYEHGLRLDRGFRGGVGLELATAFGDPIPGLRGVLAPTFGLNAFLGHGYKAGSIDALFGAGLSGSSTTWYSGGRLLARTGGPVEVGGQLLVGGALYGFADAEETRVSSATAWASPGVSLLVRSDKGPTFTASAGPKFEARWAQDGTKVEILTGTGGFATLGVGIAF